MIGFTLPSPDPQALELARWQTFNMAEMFLRAEDHALAIAFLEGILERADEENILGFTPVDIGRLRALLARAENGRRDSLDRDPG